MSAGTTYGAWANKHLKMEKKSNYSGFFLMGSLISKIEFWAKRYEFSFQFWGDGNNNVFINKDFVELASFGGRNEIKEILTETIEWCEKANPRIKYPAGIEITNPQP